MSGHEFWVASGHLFLDRDADGRLVPTADFLRAYLARPELLPPEEACAAERALHARLLDDPFGAVAFDDVVDADARENWGFFRRLRDELVAAGSVEGAYLRLIGDPLPPVMMAQLVHVILRNALDGSHDPMLARAAELFFRAQRVSSHQGRVLLADAEVVEGHEASRSPLVSMLKGAAAELEVMSEENAASYWGRSDGHDLVMDLADLRPALARAMRVWIAHLLGVQAEIEAVSRIDDPDFRWFIGLDETATAMGNALWDGRAGGEFLALFRMGLPGAARPVWLLLAADGRGEVRMKPQNLIAGLPG